MATAPPAAPPAAPPTTEELRKALGAPLTAGRGEMIWFLVAYAEEYWSEYEGLCGLYDERLRAVWDW
tara:strand:- start:2891 stop:3091 length:201 start_codon:yes stop_codon:yes gene_type:complete